ncbi:MAG: UvrD-helicase domain-containing protein [Nitrospinales bacterium]
MVNILDSKERQQALDPTKSFIIQAPAGSGKTELLIQRYLKLLSGVERPEQIIAMTFTRKAATEMRGRILKALESAQNTTPPDNPHEKITWNLAKNAFARNKTQSWNILENPIRMKIMTIDSLCSGLTRQTPLLSGMGALLNVNENSDELYLATANKLLEFVENDSPEGHAVRQILNRLDNSKHDFLNRIIRLVQKRDLWMIPFYEKQSITSSFRTYLEETLEKIIESILKEAFDLLKSEEKKQLTEFSIYAGSNLTNVESSNELAALSKITTFPEPTIKYIKEWRAISSLLLTKQGKLRKTITKNQGFPVGNISAKNLKNDFIKFLDSLNGKNFLTTVLDEIQKLPSPKFSDDDWQFLKAMFYLLPEMSKCLRNSFIENQSTDFTQIELSALKSLGDSDNPTDLLLKLDMNIEHILIDEFQDTSFKQFQLLKLLSSGWVEGDGRTLFLVGDPMQSIYRFRDAEVGLFIQAREQGIGDIHLTSLELKTNFRSQKKIVDWVNNCFSTIFPKVDDPDRGAIKYVPSIAYHPENANQGVVLHPMQDSIDIDEAIAITKLVEELKNSDSKPSIAILVRSRTHLKRIITQLHSAKIEFRAEEIDPLTSRPAILDLLSLMRALLSYSDRIAWLSILRAPWCSLSLVDLHQLCKDDPSTSIWELLNTAELVNRLSDDGKLRVKRLTNTLSKSLTYLPSSNFRFLLEACWMDLGGPTCLDLGTSNSTSMDDVQIFFDEVEKASIAGNAKRLLKFENKLSDLYASNSVSSEDAIQIMTMHKSKGLEFDFVILPGLGKKGMADNKKLIYWMAHGTNILMAPLPKVGDTDSNIYNFLSRLDKDKSYYENFRLLYVSATRTKKQLHIFGHTYKEKDGTKPKSGSMLNLLWPYIEKEWNSTEPIKSLAKDDADNTSTIGIKRLPSNYKTPLSLPSIEPDLSTNIMINEEERPNFEWVGGKTRFLGIVLHQLLKDITDHGLESWSNDKIHKIEPALKSALLGQGLSVSDIKSTCKQGMQALKNIINDETGRWILSKHTDAQSEFALTTTEGKKFINRRIDRTFVDKENIRWVIDYKISPHEGANLEKFFADEKERHRPQMERYENLIKLMDEERQIKMMLYYPLQSHSIIY